MKVMLKRRVCTKGFSYKRTDILIDIDMKISRTILTPLISSSSLPPRRPAGTTQRSGRSCARGWRGAKRSCLSGRTRTRPCRSAAPSTTGTWTSCWTSSTAPSPSPSTAPRPPSAHDTSRRKKYCVFKKTVFLILHFSLFFRSIAF